MGTATQSNTRQGDIRVLAGEDLSDMEGRLVQLANASGTLEAYLPNDVGDRCLYLLTDGDEEGEYVTVRPLSPDRNVRVRINGACSPGDRLTLAAINGTDDGKCASLEGAAADTYWYWGVAEEAATDEQLVLARPALDAGSVTVS